MEMSQGNSLCLLNKNVIFFLLRNQRTGGQNRSYRTGPTGEGGGKEGLVPVGGVRERV
jgi:hypothetical protein